MEQSPFPNEPGVAQASASSRGIYGGFWLRFVAAIIDGVIMWLAQWVIMIPLSLLGMGGATSMGNFEIHPETGELADPAAAMAMAGAFGFTAIIIGTLIPWVYFAYMESSPRQATLGKMALGLKVTDTNGQPISFMRATGRYFGKWISSIIFLIGFIMAGFTARKQALHDMMAGCLVVKAK